MSSIGTSRGLWKATASGAAVVALALALGACASKPMTTGSVNSAGAATTRAIETMSAQEAEAATAAVGRAYASKPSDKAIGMRYASLLQASGRAEQSLAVMRKLAIHHSTDRDVLAAYGKSLAAAGEFEPALDAVRRAQTPEYPDWKLVSAEAAILDQLGQTKEARGLYRRALDLRPNEPSVLSNLGMSYLLEGDLKTAELHLKQAIGQPGADSRVRQNLALVVGLQGRFGEAEQIASQELSAEQAQANVTYLRSILAQQNSLKELRDS